ncbi:MAG: hypothetical protein WEA28_15460, partial [Xanthobacteraceae bacterium]
MLSAAMSLFGATRPSRIGSTVSQDRAARGPGNRAPVAAGKPDVFADPRVAVQTGARDAAR